MTLDNLVAICHDCGKREHVDDVFTPPTGWMILKDAEAGHEVYLCESCLPGGYWVKTEKGTTAHVLGDPNPSPETAAAIEAVIDAARERFIACPCS